MKSAVSNNKKGVKIIGLTGGIGSGKSTVANYIQEFGFPVYNSDYWAKELVNFDESLRNKITYLLGESSYDEHGNYDKNYVASVVFENDELLQMLNQIIHPAVKEHFENWIKTQDSEFVFKETALLFELKLHENCFQTILVTADDNIRIKRVMDRDGRTYREVEAIMQKQMLEKDKIKLANFIIENNSDLDTLKNFTKLVLLELQKMDL